MNVARTILTQIKQLDRMVLAAWGAKDYVETKEGVQFRVGGMAKFKGLVHVKYNRGADAYDIDFIKMRKGMPVVTHDCARIYADNLVNVIDMVVQ
jgi:hypothetical protein